MSEPNDYLAIVNLQQALQAVRAADGYHYDLATVTVKLNADCKVQDLLAPGAPRPFCVIKVSPEAWQYAPAEQVIVKMPVTIYWCHDCDPTDDADLMRVYFRGCSDIERAIAKDSGRGGRARDTRLTGRTLEQTEEGGAAELWAVVDVELSVYRTYGQPDA